MADRSTSDSAWVAISAWARTSREWKCASHSRNYFDAFQTCSIRAVAPNFASRRWSAPVCTCGCATRPRVKSRARADSLGLGRAIGRDHRPGYDRQRPDLFASLLRSVKAGLDPAGTLNPGGLIDSHGPGDRAPRPVGRQDPVAAETANHRVHSALFVSARLDRLCEERAQSSDAGSPTVTRRLARQCSSRVY
ncbi:MAG: hypothetical protein JRJ58_05760 [Deltaproteobacteria bacterium]|nr:hypothetical protein [Deltaproteobacteria bacterium]